MSTVLFIILWPALWLFLPLTRRTRAVIVKDGKILLVKNFAAPDRWALPGGGIKRRESVIQALGRELEEELGVQIASAIELVKEPIVFHQYGLLLRYHFVAVELPADIHIKKNWEIRDVQWLPIDKLTDVAPEVTRGLALKANR